MNIVKNVLFWFTCSLVALTALRLIGPELETRIWPVYSKFAIETATVLPDGKTEVVFRFTKYRYCESRGATWADGELGQTYDIAIGRQTVPNPRPLGEQLSRPYTFNATPDEIRSNLVASIFSRCPMIPWETRSEVFP